MPARRKLKKQIGGGKAFQDAFKKKFDAALKIKLEPPPPAADAPTGLTGQPLPPPPPLSAQERERVVAG